MVIEVVIIYPCFSPFYEILTLYKLLRDCMRDKLLNWVNLVYLDKGAYFKVKKILRYSKDRIHKPKNSLLTDFDNL